MPLVRGILGPDCVLANAGVMLSLPGSERQPWHRSVVGARVLLAATCPNTWPTPRVYTPCPARGNSDGDHIWKTHRAPHCLNVFIPLVDITRDNGGTELVPGTHVLGEYDCGDAAVTPLPA